MKEFIILLVVLILIGGAAYFFFIWNGNSLIPRIDKEEVTETESEEELDTEGKPIEIIGTSVEGRDITAYHYSSATTSVQAGGTDKTELLFVGGIHGGYSWNTALVAYELMDYLEENPDAIPENVKVTVVPVLNPDGLHKVVGTTTDRFTQADIPTSRDKTIPGRFNANEVDLNRNFDCDWQAEGMWQSREVSGGSEVFSEPESRAIRDYINAHKVSAVVVWYSAAGGVFASNCHGGVLPETSEIMKVYADASGYRAYESYDFYETTGDMTNWLAKEEIPAISVLLSTHEDIEWDKNKAGIEAFLTHYAE